MTAAPAGAVPGEVASSPLDFRIEELIPHRPPMVFLDALLDCTEQNVTCVSRLADKALLRNAAGDIPASAAIELMAQAAAVFAGVQARLCRPSSAPKPGFIVSMREFKTTCETLGRDAEVIVKAEIDTVTPYACQFRGEVRRREAGSVLASGTFHVHLLKEH